MHALLETPHTWAAFLADAAIKGAVILAFASVALFMLSRASAAMRHLVSWLALAALVAMPVLVGVLPAWRVAGSNWFGSRDQVRLAPIAIADVPPAPAPVASKTFEKPIVQQPLPATPEPRVAPAAPVTVAMPPALAALQPIRVTEPPKQVIPASVPTPPAVVPARTVNPSHIVLGVWGAGFVIAVVPLLIGMLAMHVIRRRLRPVTDSAWLDLLDTCCWQMGLARDVKLLEGGPATMPTACGMFRAAILLPSDAGRWPISTRRAVLLHELAHVARRDCLTQAIAQVAAALHWFNPLTWLSVRRLRVERERACDDLVVMHGARPSDYAACLLEVAQTMRGGRYASLAGVAMARPSQLEGRLLAILDGRSKRAAISRRGAAIAAALAVCLIVPISALRFTGTADAAAPKSIFDDTPTPPKPADPKPPAEQPKPQPKPAAPEKPAPAPTPAPEPTPAPARVAPPGTAAQQKAEKLVRELFAEDYAQRNTAAKQALAKKLFRSAAETRDDAAAQFVQLREARDLAASVGDIDIALVAIEALAASFTIDPTEMRLAVLTTADRAGLTANAGQTAKTCLKLSRDSIDAANFDAGIRFAIFAENAARRAKDTALATEAMDAAASARRLQGAAAILAKSPDDKAANSTIGTYYCFVRGDWAKGLPMIAAGSDATLAALANRELKPPTTSAAQFDLANAWWEAGQKLPLAQRPAIETRAGSWYRQAMPELKGLSRALAEKRSAGAPALAMGTASPATPQKSVPESTPTTPKSTPSTAKPASNPPPTDTTTTAGVATGSDWPTLSAKAAAIESATYLPVPLVESTDPKGWVRVPEAFKKAKVLIYSEKGLGQGGVAEFKVTRSGLLLIACNYSYQGNRSGGWTETRLTKEQMIEQGWKLLDSTQLGGALVGGGSQREQEIFSKDVKQGETYKIRCNKYDPPFVLLPAPGATSTAAVANNPAPTKPPSAEPGTAGKTVNLLPLFDVNTGPVAGAWKMEGGALISDDTKNARIQSSYRPPAEYDFVVEFTRPNETATFVQLLARGDTAFEWSVGNNTRLQDVDKHARNRTTRKAPDGFADGKRHTSIVQVRNAGIKTLIDGVEALDFPTDYANLSRNSVWNLRDDHFLGLGTWNDPIQFHKVEVIEVSGAATPGPGASAAPAPPEKTAPSATIGADPTPVTLLVVNDDDVRGVDLLINGKPVENVRAERFRKRGHAFQFDLRATDRVAVKTTDRGEGALLFCLLDNKGGILSYSKAGTRVSGEDGGLADFLAGKGGVPGVPVTTKNKGMLDDAAGDARTPRNMPADWESVWLADLRVSPVYAHVFPVGDAPPGARAVAPAAPALATPAAPTQTVVTTASPAGPGRYVIGMLGTYVGGGKGLVNLNIPDGKNVINDQILDGLRGKRDLTLYHWSFTTRGYLDVPADGSYTIEVDPDNVIHLDGIDMGPGAKRRLRLTKGCHLIKLTVGNNGGQLPRARLAVRNDAKGDLLPIFVPVDELNSFMETAIEGKPPVEVTGWSLANAATITPGAAVPNMIAEAVAAMDSASRPALDHLGPGLWVFEYPKLPGEADGGGTLVNPGEFAAPIGAPLVTPSLSPWRSQINRNNVAVGYLLVDRPGNYSLQSRSWWGRHLLYVDGKLLSQFGKDNVTIETDLSRGLHEIMIIKMVSKDDSFMLEWRPPGEEKTTPIPETALYHDYTAKTPPRLPAAK